MAGLTHDCALAFTPLVCPKCSTCPACSQELESRGIWDFDRLCEPYITDEVWACRVTCTPTLSKVAPPASRAVCGFMSSPCCAGVQVLLEVFGAELAPEVAARYLQEQASGRYRFRQQYTR